jgi:hypothetical protein
VDWDHKASVAIGFIKATKTLPQIALKMYLKSLAILEKATIPLKKSSKII